jgi:membrane associated rhomboid family serine protease
VKYIIWKIHLLGNVMIQLETGLFYEKEWGSLNWFVIYIGSSIGSTIFMQKSISVGSSGAVMGLFGGKLCEVFLRRVLMYNENSITTNIVQDEIAREVRKEQCFEASCSVILVLLFSFIPFAFYDN